MGNIINDEVIMKNKDADVHKEAPVKKHRVAILDYTLGEELVSAISHGLGTLLAIAGTVLCIVKAAMYCDTWAVVGASIFGASMIILYCMSTLYHALKPNTAKRVFRVIDHCCVFLLIAGTYTPYLFVSIRGMSGWVLFGIEWGLAIIGIVFNAIDVDKYEKLSAVVNILMGWAIIAEISKLTAAIGQTGMWLLIGGGIAYTVGAILYAIGGKIRYMHSIWHFFVLAGTILHFFSIFIYVLD